MKVVNLILIVLLFFSQAIYAENDGDPQDVELLKLRIRELELKKEIMELESKKQEKSTNQVAPVQPYAITPNSNLTPSGSSGYIRGPRGGCYTYSKSGNKRYVDRGLCN